MSWILCSADSRNIFYFFFKGESTKLILKFKVKNVKFELRWVTKGQKSIRQLIICDTSNYLYASTNAMV